MPSITGETYYLVAGVRVDDLKKGVGHYPSTPLPGQYGNAALAGHRTTYGAPFYKIDRLKRGDRIFMDTPYARFRYEVAKKSSLRGPRLELEVVARAAATRPNCVPAWESTPPPDMLREAAALRARDGLQEPMFRTLLRLRRARLRR